MAISITRHFYPINFFCFLSLKNTEISLRKMAHRLADIKRTVAYDDQPPIQSAIDSLEKIRTDLLNKMFGKNAK